MFLSDGCVAMASLNGVGSWHDARVDTLMQIDHRLRHLDPRFVIAVDTGFASSERKIRVLNEVELSKLSLADAVRARTAGEYLTRLRIAAEWGIAGLHKAWHILVLRGYADDPIQRTVLSEVCVRLHNLRCREMNICQIRSVFE